MIDLQRAHRRDNAGDRRQRDRGAGRDAVSVHAGAGPGPSSAPTGHVGLHEDVLQLRRIGLKPRLALEDDLIIVGRRVNARHLARAEGVEQLLTDLVDSDAVDGRHFAVHFDRHLRILDVEIGGDVAQPLDLGDPVAQFRRHVVEELGVTRLQRVLVLALGNAAGDVDVLNVLEIHRHAGNGIGGVAQALNHRGGIFAALFPRLERNKHAPDVGRRVRPARSHRRIDVVDRGIGADDCRDLSLQVDHTLE